MFTINNFDKVLFALGQGISTRSSLPILKCVHFQVKDHTLTMSATNLETAVILTQSLWQSDQSFVVEYSHLKAIGGKVVNIGIVDHEDYKTITISGSGKSLSKDYANDFTLEFPQFFNNREIEIHKQLDVDYFLDRLSLLAVTCATDNARPVLTGIYSNGKESASTDSFSLMVTDQILPTGMIYPAQSAKKVIAIAKKIKKFSMVTVGKSYLAGHESQALISVSFPFFDCDCTILSQKIDGNFPDYSPVIPKNDTKVIFNTEILVNALKFMPKKQPCVDIDDKGMTCHFEGLEYNKPEVKSDYPIHFNHTYLSRVANLTKDYEIVLKVRDGYTMKENQDNELYKAYHSMYTPMIFTTPVYTYVLMPMFNGR